MITLGYMAGELERLNDKLEELMGETEKGKSHKFLVLYHLLNSALCNVQNADDIVYDMIHEDKKKDE